MCQFIDNSNIFIHIPKCGGTYIMNNLLAFSPDLHSP